MGERIVNLERLYNVRNGVPSLETLQRLELDEWTSSSATAH